MEKDSGDISGLKEIPPNPPLKNGGESRELFKKARKIVLLPIYGYQYLIRPILPMVCRFEPSCSCYAIEAIQTLGILRGIGRSILRLLRCHPWCAGGYDPVVPVLSRRDS